MTDLAVDLQSAQAPVNWPVTMADWVARWDGVKLVKHAILTFSGTWAAPGTGYPSQAVAGADTSLMVEVPVIAPWTFGPIGGPPDSPSYADSVDIAVQWAIAWINAHPQQTFGLVGYSQGAEAASRVLIELQSGSLTGRIGDFVGGATFGNPYRQVGHTFPGGAAVGGRGIAPVNLANTPDSWFDYANPGDMYTTTPTDDAGKDITAVYKAAVKLGMRPNPFPANVVDFASSMSEALLGSGGLAGQIVALLDQPLIAGPALIEAVAIAGTFAASQTRPHISYDVTECVPGVTSVQHASAHLTTLCSTVIARRAAV